MTCYVARTGGKKKKNILAQREIELRGDICRGESKARIDRKAERVRSAQQAVIKVLLEESSPVRQEDEERFVQIRESLVAKKRYWEAISIEEIIEIYSREEAHASTVDRKRI